jgi:hypothetical protein
VNDPVTASSAGSLAIATNPKQSLGRRPFLVVAGLVVSICHPASFDGPA